MILRRATFVAGLLVVSMLILTGCGSPTTLQPTVIRISATPPPVTDTPPPPAATAELPGTGATPQSTQPPAASPTSPPAAAPTEAGETITFSFQNTLTSVEDLDDLRALMLQTEGIMTVTGTEVSVSITYDPDIFTVDELVALLDQLDFPVKPPE